MITVALGLSGCLGGETAPVTVVGKYKLQAVNGLPLPFTFPNGISLKAETIELKDDGSFTDVAERSDGSVVNDIGTYTNYGGTVVLFDQTLGFVYQGQVEGKTMTVVVGNYSERFVRD